MTPPLVASPGSVKQRAIRGIAWTLPTSLASRVVGLVGTLVLARFLAPAEYGEVSAAAILTVTASTVTTFGIGLYLVTNREAARAEVFHATCWFLGTGVVAMAIVWVLRRPLGLWFDAPALGRFMPLFVLSVLIDRVTYLPERMLVRQLRFGWPSLVRAFSELAYTGASLGAAALGVGGMAIAWGNLARSTLRFVAIVPAVEWREWLEPHRLRLATMAKIIGYGVTVSMTTIASWGMSRWDNLLVARFFGPSVMGAYNYAYNLADTPAMAVGEPMSDVISTSFPHFERKERAMALVRSFHMISLVMLPLAFGLGAVARTAVQTFFDQRWSSVADMLSILAVLSVTRPMAHILHSYLYACERHRAVLYLEWASLLGIVVAISAIGRLGIDWTCGAVGAVFVLRTLSVLWTVHRVDAIPVRSFLSPLAGPTAACVAMVSAIVFARPALNGLTPAVRLVLEVGVGFLVYMAGALLLFRPATLEFLRLVRSALLRR